MIALNNAEFLALWEAGHRLHALDRGLLAIRASLGTRDAGEPVADWPLGRRNRALAEMRMLYFGPRLEGWTTCEECGEKFEFELDCRALAASPEAVGREVTVEGRNFRLPTSRDLARVAMEPDVEHAVTGLLRVCAVDGSVEGWTAEAVGAISDAVSDAMANADPLAEITLGFDCPVCHRACEESLDLPSFLWSEIESRARRLLGEVHALASAYGWTEAAILAMSDVRRMTYLQMVHA